MERALQFFVTVLVIWWGEWHARKMPERYFRWPYRCLVWGMGAPLIAAILGYR